MNIHVFLLCYNESALLPHAVAHYRKHFPTCNITIYDNESTDNSLKLALSLKCNVYRWSSENIIDDFKYIDIKNNCWKSVESGWIIMADMDEFLCITESELKEEKEKGTIILRTQGYDMIGESTRVDLTDIDLQQISKYVLNDWESKHICFLREKIEEMNYGLGAHSCNPVTTDGLPLTYSEKTYWNKHMNYLGLPFYIQKIINRYERSKCMREKNLAIHYINNVSDIEQNYLQMLEKSTELFP